MLDPGSSAFLMGYGFFLRCISHLEEHGFNKETLKFVKCDRKFFFVTTASFSLVAMPVVPADGR